MSHPNNGLCTFELSERTQRFLDLAIGPQLERLEGGEEDRQALLRAIEAAILLLNEVDRAE